MRIPSPLNNLSDVLDQIRGSAERYQQTLVKNEAATRVVLIDPVLRVLGWDIADTDMVELEKTLDRARADYALYDKDRTVRVIIEAKSLDTNLSEPDLIMSLVNYAFRFQLQDIFLTDGKVWRHFTNFQPGDVRVERVLNMAGDDLVECAAYLVQRLDAARFWPKEEIVDILAQRVTRLESTAATLQQEIDRLKLTPKPKIDSPYIELEKLSDIAGKRPSLYRLPDGTDTAVKHWKDVLRESCRFALANTPDIPIPLKDRAGGRVWLLNVDPPTKGRTYVTEQYKGQTIYVDLHYSSQACIANALYILEKVPPSSTRAIAAVAIAEEQANNGS